VDESGEPLTGQSNSYGQNGRYGQSGASMAGQRGAQMGNSTGSYNEWVPGNNGQPNAQNPRSLPEALTEFQKYTALTTGRVLPIFGHNLFSDVPTTFAPLNMAPVPPGYLIGPGDQLQIRIWGQVSFQANVLVDRSGDIYLPQVGPVHVAGLPYASLEAHIRSAVGRVYRNFDLTVDLGKIRAIQVYVTGQARRPGLYTVSSLSTLVDALFASGGPSVKGSMRDVELHRDGKTIAHFDLYDLLVRGDKSKDAKLLDGDVIFIPPVSAEVAVTGSVGGPAIYELRPEETLGSLLADAGGVSAVAEEARISIERIEDHRTRHAMEVAYDASGLATPLSDGDLVHVFSIVPAYTKTVTLRGNVANPGHFAWHSGMRISDLIPDKESLITRNYWWKRAQLGLPSPEFEPALNLAQQYQPSNESTIQLNTPTTERSEGSPQQQRLSAQQRAGSASLAAEQSETTTHGANSSQRTVVDIVAPEIDWDYAVVERIDMATLKTELLPFDLGKLVLQHDSSQDLELQPGDIVTIFSEGDIRVPLAQQTKLVRLSGEFVHAGVYTAKPGETLRELVAGAGGLTPNAYLYGSDFTRESTRAIQQARIDEYVRDLSTQVERSNLELASSSVSSSGDASNAAAAQASEAGLLAGLRQIRATGRIVLQFKPDTAGTASIPDIPLEDGDQFVVPHVPATVNVVGAVYDQSSFLYSRDRRVSAYLALAGGPNRDADKKHEFIIRADGEVVGRETMRGLWGNTFESLRIYPGDTIVVPDKTFKPSLMRGFLDWSQAFSQLALGAAAVNVIK